MKKLFVSIDTTLINKFIRDAVKNEVNTFVVYHNRMFAVLLIETFSQHLLRIINLIRKMIESFRFLRVSSGSTEVINISDTNLIHLKNRSAINSIFIL
jgi:hypothetical protein